MPAQTYKFSDLKQALKKNEPAAVINDIVANLSPADINKAVKTFNPGLEESLFAALTPEMLQKVAASLDPSVAAGLANLPPVFLSFTQPTYTDTAGDDQFAAAVGTFKASDLNNNALTYGLMGASAVALTVAGITYDQVASSAYGALYLNSTTGAYRFAPNDGAIEALSSAANANFSVTVSDGTFTASQLFSVTLNGVNDAPVVANAIADQSSPEDAAWSYQVPANAFSDVDNATLSYSATLGNGAALPSWLSFNAATRTFSGTPPLDFNGQIDLTVTASDGTLSASDTFTITVTAVNDAPVVANAIADQSSPEDAAWSYQVPANAFSDVDNATLSYSATLGNGAALPSWLSFNAATRTFSGTPPLDFNGQIDLTVTASDGTLSASDTFTITVTAVNDAPTTAPVALAAIAEDSGARLITQAELLANASDVDGPGLAAVNLQIAAGGGTLIDNGNGTWSYMPAANDDTHVSFSYTVADGSLSTAGSATLDITPVDDAPSQAGTLDIVTVNGVTNTVSILLGDGAGGFSSSTVSIGGGLGPVAAALGDINNDGHLDIVTANYHSNNLGVLLADGTGGFAASTIGLATDNNPLPYPASIALGDLNDDGHLDIVTANAFSAGPLYVSVLLGDGAGGFAVSTAGVGDVSGTFGTGNHNIAVGDLDNDGDLDVVTANRNSSNVSVLLGDGAGGFTASTTGIAGFAPSSVALGDLNKDGNLDIVTGNIHNSISVLLGDGAGQFAASNKPLGPVSVVTAALGDVDGDDDLDIVNAYYGGGDVTQLLGNGTGGFAVDPIGSGPVVTYSVALGDLNGDGNLDIAGIGNAYGDVTLLFGDGTGGFTAGTAADVPSDHGAMFVALGYLDEFNAAPTAVVLTDPVTSIPENGRAIKVADIAVTDDAPGTNVLSLAGADASAFNIRNGNELWFDVRADYEAKSAYDVTVVVDDPRVGGSADASQAFHLAITDTNDIEPVAAPLGSTPVPIGAQQRVNTFTSGPGSRTEPTVTALDGGGFVVIWAASWQDFVPRNFAGDGIYGQRYAADGTPVGGEFLVNTGYTFLYQNAPSVAAIEGGGFVVTWADGTRDGVYGQRYGADGGPAGGEFLVNTFSGEYQLDPAVARLADGGFVVTWQSTGHSAFFHVISGQRYDQDGIRVGGEFVISDDSPLGWSAEQPHVAGLPDGGFVATWKMPDGIWAHRYDATGLPAGDQFQVNAFTAYSQEQRPVVAALADGSFVVTWWTFAALDGSASGVFGQRYAADGTPLGDNFQVNTFTYGYQTGPSITSLADGGFVVTWTSGGVHGQRYAADGTPVGGEFGIAAGNGGEGTNAVATLADGNLVQVSGSYPDVYVRLVDPSYDGPPMALQHFTGPAAHHVAIDDFNGDGKADLAVANAGNGTVAVLLGAGDGGYGAPTILPVARAQTMGDQPSFVATADLNSDGHADIVSANYGYYGSLSLWLGNGNGTFGAESVITTGQYPYGVAIGDLNSDGKLDLAVADGADSSVSVFFGNGSGGFGSAQGFAAGLDPRAITIGDFNNDGNADLAVANYSSQDVSVLLGTGTGSFAAPASYSVGAIANAVKTADLNDDGNFDLVVAHLSDSDVSVLLGNGDGTFDPASNYAVGGGAQYVEIADLNGDGKFDFAFNSGNDIAVLEGNGDGTFADAVYFPAVDGALALAIGDIDGQGLLDIAVTSYTHGSVSVLLNTPAADDYLLV